MTTLISLYDGIKQAGYSIPAYENLLVKLPLYEHSVGWLVPAIVAGVIGYIVGNIVKQK